MADDVEEFLQDHRLSNTALIGHSMGAKVAMTVALRSPSLLRAVVPVDNAPIDANLKSDFHQYVQGLREIEQERPRNQALPIRQFLLTNLVRSEEDDLRLRIPIKIIGLALDQMGDFPFKCPEEAHFDGPTLIIRGSKSSYVPDEALPLIGRFFPSFRVQDIDSGHWVITEKPEAFLRVVREFLSSVDCGEA